MEQKIAVGYPRVSSVSQGGEGYSLEAQIAQIEQFCKDNNLDLRAHFMEVESGSSISGRPTLKAALRHLYAGNADYLVVTNLDRFSRSVLDTEALRQSMARHGKKLISVQQKFFTPFVSDEDDDHELIAARQKASIDAELERKRITRRCSTGRNRKVLNGGWGGHRPWFECDVVRGKLSINKERARTIRLIMRLRQVINGTGRWKDHCMSFQQIADYLNGNNKMLNPDGTRGRVFPPPSTKLPIRERRKPLRQAPEVWGKETVRLIVQTYDRRCEGMLQFSENVSDMPVFSKVVNGYRVRIAIDGNTKRAYREKV